jgi:hypothetical protein
VDAVFDTISLWANKIPLKYWWIIVMIAAAAQTVVVFISVSSLFYIALGSFVLATIT